jgi:hypothetical protein
MKFYVRDIFSGQETEIDKCCVIVGKALDKELFEISSSDNPPGIGMDISCLTGGLVIEPVVSNVIRVEARRR